MKKATPSSTQVSSKLYRQIIKAYPPAFRQQFGDQMASAFQDLANERQAAAGRYGLIPLWTSTILDTFKTIIPEYVSDLKEDAMQHKPLAIIGGILVTPAVALFATALTLQLAGTSLYQLAGNSWLYHSQAIAAAFIFLPAAAFTINFIPAVTDAVNQRANPLSYQFAKTHFYSLTVAAIGFGLLIFIFGHDTIGCMIKNPLTGHYLSSVQHCWQTH